MEKITVWVSCGVASFAAAKLTLELYGHDTVDLVNTPIDEEDADNRRFLADISSYLNHPIQLALNRDGTTSAVDVWTSKSFMAGNKGAPCTQKLKREARQLWEETHPGPVVLGFTVEEHHRHKRFAQEQRPDILPILINAGYTRFHCFNELRRSGIVEPLSYRLGYPNANCIGCVKATSPSYWNLVRRNHPATFQARAEQSRNIGAKLARYKGRRIFLDELPATASGGPLKSMQNECGLWCAGS